MSEQSTLRANAVKCRPSGLAGRSAREALVTPGADRARSAAAPRERMLMWGTYVAAAALLLVCWESIELARYSADFHHNFDLGVYSQALKRIAWNDPNPYLTLRGLRIFNDHFDPVLLLAAPLAKVIEPVLAGMLVELAFVLATPLAVVWGWRIGRIGADSAAVAIACLLHNRATISALGYPIHPTTWAMLPMAWLAVGMLADRRRVVLVSLLALMCCKEEFPLVGLAAASVYAWRKEYRFAAALAVCSGVWIFGAIVARPWAIGPVENYTAKRLWETQGLWSQLALDWREFRLRFLTQVLAPLAPLAAWALWRRDRMSLSLWPLLAPSLALRYLGHAWKYHYLTPLAPLFILGVMPRDGAARLPRGLLATTWIVLTLINAAYWRQSVELLVSNPDATRPWRAARCESIARGREYLLAHPEGKALVEGNLAPRLVRRDAIYQLAGPHDRRTVFTYVFVEKPPFGDPYPTDEAACRRLLAEWRQSPGARVILDDAHVFLAEGAFRDLQP